MAKYASHKCPSCGKLHCGKLAICFWCARTAKIAENPKFCVVCDRILDSKRHATSYCSLACSTAINTYRLRVIAKVHAQIKHGVLPKASSLACVDCGKQAFDYDHRDYLKPLDVEPVCRSCNLKRGPAKDVREVVAKLLGVDVSEIPKAMIALRENREAERLRLIAYHVELHATHFQESANV